MIEKSSLWDYFYSVAQKMPGQRLSGFPFNVPFPKMYIGQKYEIILVSGEIVEATVDDAREFSSEGLQWKRVGGGNFADGVTAAWKLIEKK